MGNKLDLDQERKITKKQATDFIRRLRVPLYFEITNKKFEMVDNVILTGIKAVLDVRNGSSLNQINMRYNNGSWNQIDQYFELNLRRLTRSIILSDIEVYTF